MNDKLNPTQYDEFVPSWVKGLIGALAGLILVPSLAFIAVVNLGGVDDIMQAYAKQALKIQEPAIKSNENLAIQMLQLNNTLLSFKTEVGDLNEVMDTRLSAVEDTLTIHSAQIQSGLKELQKIQDWAYKHSKDGTYDYE